MRNSVRRWQATSWATCVLHQSCWPYRGRNGGGGGGGGVGRGILMKFIQWGTAEYVYNISKIQKDLIHKTTDTTPLQSLTTYPHVEHITTTRLPPSNFVVTRDWNFWEIQNFVSRLICLARSGATTSHVFRELGASFTRPAPCFQRLKHFWPNLIRCLVAKALATAVGPQHKVRCPKKVALA